MKGWLGQRPRDRCPQQCWREYLTRDIPWQVDSLTQAATPSGRLGDQLCFALYAATNAVTRVYRPLLHALGLTYPQYLVMLVLWERRSCRLGEIADELRLAPHALSPIVDRLEEAGLVRRSKDDGDGRVVIVGLTAAGETLEGGAAAVQDKVRCQTGLSADAVTSLRSELQALVERMDRV